MAVKSKNNMKTDLNTYVPKGDIKGFPIQIVAKMLEHQLAQGNEENVEIFEKNSRSGRIRQGFSWDVTEEGRNFWARVILRLDFDLFFEMYPLFNPKRGDVVLVGPFADVWSERIYVATIEGAIEPYVCVHENDKDKFKKGETFRTISWKLIKQKGPQVHLSLQDISDGKGVGVPAHLIVIKS